MFTARRLTEFRIQILKGLYVLDMSQIQKFNFKVVEKAESENTLYMKQEFMLIQILTLSRGCAHEQKSKKDGEN